MSTLDVVILVLIVAWLGGYWFQIGGNLIHVLLGIAAVMLIYRLMRGRRP